MWLGKLANCMGRETPVGMRLICPGGLKQNSCNTDLLKKINHHLLPHQKNPEKQKSTTLIQAAECRSEEFSLCFQLCNVPGCWKAEVGCLNKYLWQGPECEWEERAGSSQMLKDNSIFSGFPISCLLKTYASPVSLLLLRGCQCELGISYG